MFLFIVAEEFQLSLYVKNAIFPHFISAVSCDIQYTSDQTLQQQQRLESDLALKAIACLNIAQKIHT